MEIMTRDFGKVNVDESKIFNFPSGLFAFEECRQFALLSPLGDGVYPMWLQSTENVTPCFIVFDPAIIDGAYKITLNSSEKKLLKIDDSSNVRCLSIAVVPEDYKKTTVNMKCPIVINSDENLAAQVILPEKYEIRLPIYVERSRGLGDVYKRQMLVVTRKTDESLTISDNIEITVLEIGKDRVKIGISAPKDVKIIRNELRDAQDMNKESSQALPKAAMEALLGMKKD